MLMSFFPLSKGNVDELQFHQPFFLEFAGLSRGDANKRKLVNNFF
jgi:hypothetical protein